MNDFSHLKNKLLAEQVEDQIYHYILDTPQFIESVAHMAPRSGWSTSDATRRPWPTTSPS
jgi:hypothetical protein